MTMSMVAATTFKAPLYIAWEITHKCNAQCVHCYSDSGPNVNLTGELSTDEAINVIDQLVDAGLLVLAFSGGEPMLRDDWRTLVKHAVNCGLSVNVGTNGSCITPKTAHELKNIGVHSVTVSVDSHLPEIHDNFRNFDGLHAHAVKAIQLLVEQGVRVVVGFTPTKTNWQQGRQVIQLAINLGANAVNLSEYVPAGRGPIGLSLSYENLHAVLLEWINMREEFQEYIQVIWHDCRVGMLVSEEEKRKYLGCGAGRLVARICPDGRVTPCVFLPTTIGSFRHSSFLNMWKNSHLLKQFREREGHIKGNCGECEHLQTCGGCRAVAYAYSDGDPLAGDDHCWVKLKAGDVMECLPKGEGLPI